MDHHADKTIFLIANTDWYAAWNSYFENFAITIESIDQLASIPPTAQPLAIVIAQEQLQHADQLTQIPQRCPVIIVATKACPNQCIAYLNAGADDYITSPVLARELHARITAIARRLDSQKRALQEKSSLQFCGWTLQLWSRRLLNAQGIEMNLSSGEFNLLKAFLKRPQEILQRDYLRQLSGQENQDMNDRRIDVQISRLRQKIETPESGECIRTIRNQGYMFVAEVVLLRD